MTTYADWLGQTIGIGTPVLYAVSNGHYAQVVWGTVLKITDVEPSSRPIYDPEVTMYPRPILDYEDYWPYGRKFKLKVQPQWQSEPEGRQDRGVEFRIEWSAEWPDPDRYIVRSWYERILPKPVTIQNVEKVTVFPLPEGAEKFLEGLIDARMEAENARSGTRR